MSHTDKIYKGLPPRIKDLLIISEGWLVGSTPFILASERTDVIQDYDIIVENPELYMRSVQYLTGANFDMAYNTYGGLKFTKGYQIDIWPESLSHFLRNRKKNREYPVFNLKHMIFLITE